MAHKSYLIAFLLWFMLGTLGIHHLYLGRDAHCLLTLLTFGGFFGFGWYRDLFHLKQYVREANLEPRFVAKQAHLMCDHKTPPFSTTRFSAGVLTGAWFAYTVAFAIPQDADQLPAAVQSALKFALLPLATALGVYMVGNIGWQEGCLRVPLLASYMSFTAFHSVASRITYASFLTTLAFEFNAKRWKVPRAPIRRPPLVRRVGRISAAILLYLVLALSGLYFNTKIAWPPNLSDTDINKTANETVPFFEAIRRAYNSEMFRNILLELTIELHKVRSSSWSDLFDQVGRYTRNENERAQKILGVKSGASLQNITAAYRKLARLYHPDQHRDEDKKRRAQEMFIELQWAHEYMVGGRGKRSRRNADTAADKASGEF